MEDNKNIKMEQTTSTDENQPKKEKKRLPKKQRIVIGIVMILIACATLILGIMIQVKGFDIFSNKASVGGDNIAYASSNDGAQVASVPNLPQGKNLFNIFNNRIDYNSISSIIDCNSFSSLVTSSPGTYTFFSFKVKPNTTYTLSFDVKSSTLIDPTLFFVFSSGENFVTRSNITFSTSSSCTFIDFSFFNSYTSICPINLKIIWSNIQLEVGSVATAY
ncbi:MAG: hypothetical protein RSB59_06475, partial [Clostridia bacterium]